MAPGRNGFPLSTLLPAEPNAWSNRLLELLVGIRPACDLGEDQDDPTGDLPSPQQI
jgi:hypothetical protein